MHPLNSDLCSRLPQAGRAWTALSSAPVAHGAWAAIKHAYALMAPRVTLWMAPAHVLQDGGANTAMSPALWVF